jgi:hypothetical protein
VSLVSVQDRESPDKRCAFCHDDLGEEVAICDGCRTVLHRDCRAQLPECPTLGCRHGHFTLVPAAAANRPIVSRPAYRRALASLAARQNDGLAPREVEPEPPHRMLRHRVASGIVRLAIAPAVVPGLALLFGIFYTILYWGALGSAGSRDEERERRQALVDGLAGWGRIELGLAPLAVVAAFASFVMGGARWNAAGALVVVALGAAGLIPAMISWWKHVARTPRDVTRWVP